MPNIINEIKLDFKDVLLRPKRSTLRSRNDVDLHRHITFRNSKQTYNGIPVMASNMDTVGTFQVAKALSKHGLFTCIHKYYTVEEWKEFSDKNPDVLKNVAASSGMAETDFVRLSEILNAVPAVTFICLDVANGYSQHFVDYVRKVRAAFPTHTIIAGNVVTGEMVEELILSGADIIKVGIGPGSVCTTRMKTGVGYPQLSAVIECADAAHGLQGHIISDGGCTCPGDVAKAFGAGADFVMAGGMFAGHEQCEGEVIEKNGKKFKLFYGMSSSTAMQKHAGGVAEYRSSEGKTVEVPFKGDIEGTVLDILGGLRSACTYTGAGKLKELPRRATFIRCTQQLNTIYRCRLSFNGKGPQYGDLSFRALTMIGPEESVNLGNETLGELIFKRLKSREDKTFEFLTDLSKRITLSYQDIMQYSVNLSVSLEDLEIKQNDVLGIFSENCWESVVTILAAWHIGAAVAFINPNFIKNELFYALKMKQPKILFTSKNKLELLESDYVSLEKIVFFESDGGKCGVDFKGLIQTELIQYENYTHKTFDADETVACLMSSSGTTGLPKAVMLTHNNLKWVMRYLEDPSTFNFNHDTITLLYLPLFHIMGLMILLGSINQGKELLIMNKFKAEEFLATLERYRVNALFVVPPILQFLATNRSVPNYDLSAMETVHCGGAPASRDIEVEVTKRLKNVKVRQIYGMTEVSGAATAVPLESSRYGSVGKPFRGLSVKIVEPHTEKVLGPNRRGEIWIKGPAVMKGYLKNPEDTRNAIDHEGFMHSGDIGYYDVDGFIFIVDRLKELIKYKAFQVAPAEIEALLIRHRAVKDAAIVGKPDDRCGELPTAFIVKQPHEHVTESDIFNYVAENFSHEKHLRGGVHFVDEIPKTPSGKILRRKLKQLLENM